MKGVKFCLDMWREEFHTDSLADKPEKFRDLVLYSCYQPYCQMWLKENNLLV